MPVTRAVRLRGCSEPRLTWYHRGASGVHDGRSVHGWTYHNPVQPRITRPEEIASTGRTRANRGEECAVIADAG